MILARIELKISDEDPDKVVSLDGKLSKALTLIYEGREQTHINLDEAINKYFKTPDQKVWDKERKEATSKFTEFTKQVTKEMQKISREGEGKLIFERIQKIEKLQQEKEAFQKMLHDSLLSRKDQKLNKYAIEIDIQNFTETLLSKEEEIDHVIALLLADDIIHSKNNNKN